jgi:ABC-2 type transport system permease protein
VVVKGGALLMSPLARVQYAALARARLQMLVNSLRTKRGSFDLAARIIRITFFLVVGFVIGTGLGFGAYQITVDHEMRLLPLLFWPVMMLWQLAPVVLASFQEPVDLSLLLRFPVSFGSYVLDYLVFGLFDVSSILGGFCLAGIWTGMVWARPGLAGWAALTAVLFAAFNVLLTRMVFAWLDRWLAQRKTREVLGMVFLFLILGAQALNPALYTHQRQPSRQTLATMLHVAHVANRVQRVSPPGLAGLAIGEAELGQGGLAGAALGGLALYALAAGSLLCVRLRAQYRGESLGEAPQRVAKAEDAGRPGFDLSGPIGAVVEKELRYLARSGVMLYSLVAPLVMLFVLGRGGSGGPSFGARYALPIGVAYGFLGLTRLVYNSLGGEGAGIQLYFMSPTPMRTVMLAKNIVQLVLFAVELVIVCTIVVVRFGVPDAQMLAATACWLMFALPSQLAAGNTLSITMGYRMTLTRMSREQGATGNGLLSLLIQLLIFAIGAGVFFALLHFGEAQLAAPVFLVLAVGGVTAWVRGLARADSLAARRRDALIEILARAS